MAEAAAQQLGYEHHGQTLDELRLLSEVEHLEAAITSEGMIPDEVLADDKINKFTALQEMAIPSAVTKSVQRVNTEYDRSGRSKRVITWLGKSAIEVAESGYVFYVSSAAHRRVDVEVSEANFAQENLRYGSAQVFISPKMTPKDAPANVAKSEHLHDEDAVRVSRAIIDSKGEIVARQLESLLITDIDISVWITMLRDPNNIFGKAVPIEDDSSALPVMNAFRELEIPEELVPQGPVTILKELLRYMPTDAARRELAAKIEKYENDQELYAAKAEAAAQQWQKFDVELAKSRKEGVANLEIQRFIAILRHTWKPAELLMINRHDVTGEYIMTNELAALLEKKQRQVLASKVALETGNSKVIVQADEATVARLQTKIAELDAKRGMFSAAEYAIRQADLMRDISCQDFKVGGGCAGEVGGEDDGESSTGDPRNTAERDESSGAWKWKKGVCRVKSCPSPKPTEVGPCSVCRSCQHKFDTGQDPTAGDTGDLPSHEPAQDFGKADFFKFVKELVKSEARARASAGIM